MLLLLVSLFIPVSANLQLVTPKESDVVKDFRVHHTDFPVEIPKDLQPAKPLSGSEMFVIDIPESWFIEKNSSKDPDLIDLSVSKDEFDSIFIKNANGHYVSRQTQANDKIVTLRIPNWGINH